MISKGIKKLCKTPELIENYNLAIADKTQVWDCHHRNEHLYTEDELRSLGLYYNCPPCELIFLTRKEHSNWPHKGKNEYYKKLIGNTPWNKGGHMPEEAKRKISEKLTGTHHESRPCKDETKNKISQTIKSKGITPPSQKGKHWYTNGIINKLCFTCPDGFRPGQVR